MQVRNDGVLVMAACVSVPWCFLSDCLSVGECRESLSPSGLPEHLITCIWPDCRHTCHPSAHHPSSASSPTDGTSSPAASITCPALPDSAILQSSSTFVIRSPSLPSSLCFGNKSLKPHIGHQATESFWAPLLKRNISGPLLQEIFCNSTSLRLNYFCLLSGSSWLSNLLGGGVFQKCNKLPTATRNNSLNKMTYLVLKYELRRLRPLNWNGAGEREMAPDELY